MNRIPVAALAALASLGTASAQSHYAGVFDDICEAGPDGFGSRRPAGDHGHREPFPTRFQLRLSPFPPPGRLPIPTPDCE